NLWLASTLRNQWHTTGQHSLHRCNAEMFLRSRQYLEFITKTGGVPKKFCLGQTIDDYLPLRIDDKGDAQIQSEIAKVLTRPTDRLPGVLTHDRRSPPWLDSQGKRYSSSGSS